MESKCLLCGPQSRRSVHLDDASFTPFQHLAVTNFLPADPELSHGIQTTILPDIERDIAAISTTIDAARAALQSLEQQRDALNDVRQSFQNIISIQRRIPQEIWSEIFLYAHSPNSESEKNFVNWPFRTIWNLSQVCHTWRNLALSLHSCWSSIVLNYTPVRSPSERDVKRLEFVLERSHQHSLDITFTRPRHIKDLPLSLCHMREKVFAECQRWRTARLADLHPAGSDLRYAPLRGRLPLLERLDFESVDKMGAVVSAFKDCPRLVHVTLIAARPRMIELPAKQLKSLYLYGAIPLSDYGDLLSQCSSLEVLVVSLWERRMLDLPPEPESLTLPCLRDLTASDPDFLDSLRTLPRLEVAALDGKKTLKPVTFYAFYRLMQRSNCASNLTNLTFFVGPLPTVRQSEPHLLLSLLSQTIQLAALKLEAYVYWDDAEDDWCITQIVDMMRALEIVPGHPVTFLPRLGLLDVDVMGHMGTGVPYLKPHADFVAMLKARYAGNEVGLTILKKFHLRIETSRGDNRPKMPEDAVFDDDDTSVLRGLREDGMDFIIKCEYNP